MFFPKISKVAAVLFAASAVFSAFFTFPGCVRQAPFRIASGVVWSTTFNVTYSSDTDLADSIRSVMRQVELSLSAFNDSSTVSRINRGDSVLVDEMLTEVFNLSLEINHLSGGAFDPTLGPLINAYGFGTEGDTPRKLSEEQLDSIMELVGISGCRIENGKMIKKNPLTRFNFSAIAKGFGVDKIAEMLTRNGVSDYMVEIGGELRLAGNNPEGKPWRIQIDLPKVHNDFMVRDSIRIVELTDIAVATSGNYRNFRVNADGDTIGHTISTLTGMPAMTIEWSVTVTAPTCALADGWATALMAGADPDSIPEGVSIISNVEI